MVNPPIAPAVPVILPTILAADAVICPFAFNTRSPSESLIWVELIVKSAIFPPVNNTCDPVICPLSFNINLLFELDIALLVKPKPAISPVPVTFSVPPIDVFPLNKALDPVISPLGFTWKFEADINMVR